MRRARGLIFLLISLSAHAAADCSRGGLAISAGLGSLYGGLGVSGELQVPVAEIIRITPFVSAGLASPIYSGFDVFAAGWCAGVNVEVGRLHRFFVGPSFGSQYVDFDVDEMQNVSRVTTVVGPAFALGYKGTARFGLMWQVYGGAAWITNDRHEHGNAFAPVFGLGLGYTFPQPWHTGSRRCP